MKEKVSTVLSFILVGLLLALFFVPQKDILGTQPRDLVFTTPLTIGTTTLRVAVAKSGEDLRLGLSHTEVLEKGTGMLFILPTEEIPSFWMKDMHYGIDIIWIGEDKVVKDISVNVTPDTYPTLYSPKEKVRYVLEVPTGFVEESGIYEGALVAF